VEENFGNEILDSITDVYDEEVMNAKEQMYDRQIATY